MNAPSIEEVPPESALPGCMILRETGTMQTDASKGSDVSIGSAPKENHMMSTANHILFGRGKGFSENPGNQRMRRIVNKYKIEYINSSRAVKRKLLSKTYDEIVEGGIVFLKKAGSGSEWVEVEAEVAVEKVAHLLRCRKDQFGVQESMAKTCVGSGMSKRPSWSHMAALHQNNYNQQIPSAANVKQLEDEVLRRAVVKQQALDVVNSARMRSLLVQQLKIERLRTQALIQSLASIQSPDASVPGLQSLEAMEQGQTLLQTISSRGSMFPGGL